LILGLVLFASKTLLISNDDIKYYNLQLNSLSDLMDYLNRKDLNPRNKIGEKKQIQVSILMESDSV
jgi:hypothetical protein